jgi:rhodanese-related sulfurtransferase
MQFIQNNLLIIALIVVSGAMLLWPAIGRIFFGRKQVDVQEAVLKMNHEDAVVLDVREDKEVAQGRIPHARHIPLGQLKNRLSELEKFKAKPVIVACRSGHRSSGACGILMQNGFADVYNLAGGMAAWEQANLPVEK